MPLNAVFEFFNSDRFNSFLDSSRNGSAQNFKNQSFKLLIESMSLATLFFFIQLFFFNIIKNFIPEIYQTNVLLNNMKRKVYGKPCDDSKNNLNKDFDSTIYENFNSKSKFWSLGFGFEWILLLYKEDIEQFENLGLDSFYFLNFLYVLQKFFGVLSVSITPILCMVHYHYSNKSTKYGRVEIRGLDKFSIYSMTVHESNMLYLNLCGTLIIIGMFHWMLEKEIQFVIQKRLQFANYIQKSYNSIKSSNSFQADTTNANKPSDLKSNMLFIKNMHKTQSTVLIHDAPICSYSFLHQLLTKLEFQNERYKAKLDIFYIPKEIKQLIKYQKTHRHIIDQIESIELDHLLDTFFVKHKDKVNLYFETMIKKYKEETKSLKVLEYQGKKIKYKHSKRMHKFKYAYKMLKYKIKINKKTLSIGKYTFKYYILSINLFRPTNYQNEVEYINNRIKKYLKNLTDWREFRKNIQQDYVKEQLQQLKNYKTTQLIVKFDDVYKADLFCQILVSSSPKYFKKIERKIDFNHLIWKNVVFSNCYLKFIGHCLVNIIQSFIMIGWSIPVAVLGFIFQTPYLAKFVPLINLLYSLPNFFSVLINSIVPIITLILLTELVPEVFRFLMKYKYFSSLNKAEINLQKWFFVFSFIQIFIVVTLSSGISIIFEKVITNPTSIPSLLATNFPQCSNFFVSFIYIRGLGYSMGNLIQWARVLEFIIKNYLCISSTKTPRAQFEYLSKKSLVYKWGSVYPIFTLMASIGIIYGIIQPIILPVAFVAFSVVLMSFKFSIKYQVNRTNNELETMGSFYPVALFQMYSGIYCLEGFMIGLFVLSKKYFLSIIMFSVLVASIVAHCQLSKKYKKLLKYLPLSDYEPMKHYIRSDLDDKKFNEFGIPGNLSCIDYEKNIDIVSYADPDLVNSIIWIPKDVFGESDQEVDRLKFLFGQNLRITNLHASINSCGDVHITS